MNNVATTSITGNPQNATGYTGIDNTTIDDAVFEEGDNYTRQIIGNPLTS